MDSSTSHCLTALIVFKNLHKEELVRSLHVYRSEDGKEKEVERAYVFRRGASSYVEMEMVAHPLVEFLQKIRGLDQGRVIGSWLCIFSFEVNHPLLSTHIPSLLSISRNPKLKSIPTLANDLQEVFQLSCRTKNSETVLIPAERMIDENKDTNPHSERALPVLDQDLNCLPYSVDAFELTESQESDLSTPGTQIKKKKRAATEHIARIALEDLVKYFDHPIVEASRKLKVGLTVLKKKCREFGIPRWPHRKIKSLDSLIHNLQLQEEVERQQEENKAAAMAVSKRQRMLETEKEIIEREPFTEIQRETKRFRQDVFKRRHRARALKSQCSPVSPPSIEQQ